MHSKSPAVAALKAAFPHTIPIFAGFLFLGMTYGVYMRTSGFSFWYPMIMSVVIFGGSLEFVATSMLLAPFAPVQVFLTAVMIQARHLFYGISMLDKYKGTGWKKPYLIYAMCDETFSVNYTAEIPEGADRGWFYFFVSLLDEFYWFLGATLGGILGGLLRFNTEGLDFVMTAMFVVIFMDQWLKEKHHFSAWIGLIASVACLLIFGADNFLIPTMICILVALTALRKPVEAKTQEAVKWRSYNRPSPSSSARSVRCSRAFCRFSSSVRKSRRRNTFNTSARHCRERSSVCSLSTACAMSTCCTFPTGCPSSSPSP